MDFPAPTPRPPYYAVIFTSQRTADDEAGYEAMAQRMLELARQQPGFLGMESVRNAEGRGMTVSYWQSLEAIQAWGKHVEHRIAQATGRAQWYEAFQTRIARVENEGLI